ncbi:D-alanyl-D-alanine carboxypeptidase/D-alanyl-D-alanine-endopeptidase [Jiangella asiatica]|uniref:D-alanyl-D-alanine carboxypeptidase/D-alanyl-D-alanine-endopeptidase n=1 Tax=Jiangella asiatica TaxID=2530372 RepID=A0A4R5D9M3_9ACTN|nr:D-alanyl-D-alanine carboxypeptidase/D-alanyl-D-alanine-endopeptidase [Jiangella asiatica]TDE08451.1 D-alanyl-D-alanine carboxypeptidase/D-alanyl-D-alanine-endopeptidase [Jiangella asiatica]
MADQLRRVDGPTRRTVLGMLGSAPLAASGLLALPRTANAATVGQAPSALSDPELNARIQEILDRPVWDGATWALKYQAIDSHEPIFALNSDSPSRPASAMKLFIGGTAYQMLGVDHRFHTRVYRTGPVVRGVLRGHVLLVAGGDLLLGGRVRPDGSLSLVAPDHTYGGDALPVPGDPLQSLRDLADQVAAAGVRRVEGSVLVDASLFREGRASTGNASDVPVSPMMVNDNVIDVVVRPGTNPDDPAVLEVTPQLGYVDIINEATTISEESGAPLRLVDDVENPDGSHTVRLTGNISLTDPHTLLPYWLPDPVRFAELAFAEALRDKAIHIEPHPRGNVHPEKLTAAHGEPTNQLAELVSPPLSEAVKPMLKLSNNIHTAHWPYVVGAVAGHEQENPEPVYERMRDDLFTQAGLDPRTPGTEEGRYSPDFFVQFLTHMSRQTYLPEYLGALPVLGKEGTLTHVGVDSPAAGHVFAKTGGSTRETVGIRALCGFIENPDGQWIAFASFIERPIASEEEGRELQSVAMEALGEIATVIYERTAS